MKAALCFASNLYSGHIASTIYKNTFNTKQKGWIGFPQYALQRNELPAVFEFFPSLVTIALGRTRPSPLATVLIDVEGVAPEISNTGVIVVQELLAPSHAL